MRLIRRIVFYQPVNDEKWNIWRGRKKHKRISSLNLMIKYMHVFVCVGRRSQLERHNEREHSAWNQIIAMHKSDHVPSKWNSIRWWWCRSDENAFVIQNITVDTHLTAFDCVICNSICVSMRHEYWVLAYAFCSSFHHPGWSVAARLRTQFHRCDFRKLQNSMALKITQFTVVVLLRHVHSTAKSVLGTNFRWDRLIELTDNFGAQSKSEEEIQQCVEDVCPLFSLLVGLLKSLPK